MPKGIAATPKVNLSAGPVNLRQTGIDDLLTVRSTSRGSPPYMKGIVSIGPSSFGHHFASDEYLIRVVGPHRYFCPVDWSLIGRPSGHRVRAVDDYIFEIVCRNSDT